jgi:PTH1 family peptidyl-tRNA hydrolase
MKLFVGLGNPGGKYARNRHNVGFMAVERIAARHSFGVWKRKYSGLVADGELAGERVLLLKPETFMNDSGRAVGEAMRYLKLAESDVVVFHDEIDLAPGKLKVKTGGGNAGHNGLRSISAQIGNDYTRVRIGVGHPGVKELVHAWVLHDFAKADADWLEPLLDAIAHACLQLAKGDEARFLSDVALQLQQQDEPRRAPDPPPPPRSSHPAGEAHTKRQSALATNLRRWLGARDKSEKKQS